VCAPPELVQSPKAIAELLEESDEWTEEWAESLYGVVSKYNVELRAVLVEKGESVKGAKKACKSM